jgi:hypothetical protein
MEQNTNRLREHFSALSDEELVRLLNADSLVHAAAAIAREELAGRHVDILAIQAPSVESVPSRLSRDLLKPIAAVLRRCIRFPMRAALGREPLWAVFVFGGAAVAATFSLMTHSFAAVATMNPVSRYTVLVVGYSGMAMHGISIAWWGVALWRSGGHTRSRILRGMARVLAVICALQAILGPIGGAAFLSKYDTSAGRGSVMEPPAKN